MKFREEKMGRTERKIKNRVEKVSNLQDPPLATDTELLVDHSVWKKGKKKRTFGQAALHLVVDGAELIAQHQPWPQSIEKGNKRRQGKLHKVEDSGRTIDHAKEKGDFPDGYRTDGLSVYRVGKGMNIIVPSYMGTSFMTQGKYSQTWEGKRRSAFMFMFILILSYIFLIYYLPQSGEVDEGQMLTGKLAIVIYCLSGMTIFYGWWYGKKATAYRIIMHCFNPKKCDLNDVHIGLFVCEKFSIQQQIEWWTGMDITDAAELLNQDLIKKNSEYRREVVSLLGQVKAARIRARVEAHDYFARLGFLYKDSNEVKYFQYTAFGLTIAVVVLVVHVLGGG